MIFSIILAGVFVFGALVCYASCCAAARADRQSEEYFALKEQENKVVAKYTLNDIRELYGLEPISENLKDSENSDII